jgi:hypothetical protein
MFVGRRDGMDLRSPNASGDRDEVHELTWKINHYSVTYVREISSGVEIKAEIPGFI